MTTSTAIKERPILFSAPMVKAILREIKQPGTGKRQTRRIIKPQPPLNEFGESVYSKLCGPEWYEPTVVGRDGEERPGKPVFGIYSDDGEWGMKCRFEPGMRLWVQESFYVDLLPWANGGSLKDIDCEAALQSIYYRVDGECCQQIPECACAEVGKTKWRTGRFMPRWASRLLLEVTDVRVQRLQDISEEDADAEGTYDAMSSPNNGTWNGEPATICIFDKRLGFAQYWDNLNGKTYPWSSNPWILAVSFKPLTPSQE